MLAHKEYDRHEHAIPDIHIDEQFYIHEQLSILRPRTDALELQLHSIESNQLGYSVIEYQAKLSLTDACNNLRGGLTLTRQWQVAHLTSFIIDSDARGRSLGSQLLERAEQIAKDIGCQMIILETSTLHNYEFYLRRGYQVTSEIPDYMPGQCYLQMKKILAADTNRS